MEQKEDYMSYRKRGKIDDGKHASAFSSCTNTRKISDRSSTQTAKAQTQKKE